MWSDRDYAERIIIAGSPHMCAADIDRYLELRMRRQKRLAEEPWLTAIKDRHIIA